MCYYWAAFIGLDVIKMNKEKLDKLLIEYKAQPVGNGYIDIIVMRENIDDFVNAILEQKINITAISWWDYCSDNTQKSELGMGGPRSDFYPGWFSEITSEFDKLEYQTSSENYKAIDILKIIENKVITLQANKYSFKDTKTITPGFWLDVPNDWCNILTSLPSSNIKRQMGEIDEILWNDWDPIGIKAIAPRDEYQSYTPTIFKLKNTGADRETIANTLHEIETVTIGVVGNLERCRQIADKIIKLK